MDEKDNIEVLSLNANGLPESIKLSHIHSWPLKTDVHCWWCIHSFDTTPCPMVHRVVDRNNTMQVSGIFCSWNCAKAYILKNKKSNVTPLLNQTRLIQKIYNETLSIKPAPSIHAYLKQFGGTMTIEEYRSKFITHICDSNKPKVKDNIKNINFIKVNEDQKAHYCYEKVFGFMNTNVADVVPEVQSEYKLKRSKPLKKKGSLEESMGLKVLT